MKRRRFALLLGLCLARAASLAGGEPRLRGQIFDREALLHARSYCVDTSNLGSTELSGLDSFLEVENRPNKLLSKFPWKFTVECGKADLVARVYFMHVTLTRRGEIILERHGGMPSSETSELLLQPVLLIYGQTAIQLVYRTEGRKKGGNPEALLASPFSDLLSDLKTLRN